MTSWFRHPIKIKRPIDMTTLVDFISSQPCAEVVRNEGGVPRKDKYYEVQEVLGDDLIHELCGDVQHI